MDKKAAGSGNNEGGDALIELRDVSVALNGRMVLRHLNWSLHPGEHWSVVGANGSGKSTFLRLLRGEVWPAPGKGERLYRLDGDVQTSAVGIAQQVALVSPEAQQRYLQQDWRLSAQEVMQTGFAQSDLLYTRPALEQRHHVQALAGRLHIHHLLRRNVQTLSTGELRKVLIGRALVGHPRILLLDEGCDGLDAAFRREMLAFIDEIARHGTQVIYTTHRADEALPAITHELVLEKGRIATAGRKQRPGSRDSASGSSLPGAGFSRTAEKTPSDGDASRTGSRPLIEIRDATVYLDRKPVLRDIDWELQAGEHWVVLGGNGAGKSTFLKLVAGEVYPALGATVERFGLSRQDTIWDLRRQIGCVSPLLQTHYRERLSAAEVVASGFFSSIGLMETPTARQRRKVAALFDRFGLAFLAAKNMGELSFGELRKVLALRALVHEPRLLIFDEPFDGLDAEARNDFARAIEAIAAGGTQLLLVTHHLDDLPRCINRGMFIEAGRIAAAGLWPAIRQHAKVMELFG